LILATEAEGFVGDQGARSEVADAPL
jgi:hypothetical protein